MKNRTLNYLDSTSNDQSSQVIFEELRGAAQKRSFYRIRQVETCVQMHPMASLVAVLGMGLFLGWVLKRK